jgi:GT2 family glycosyltransferase
MRQPTPLDTLAVVVVHHRSTRSLSNTLADLLRAGVKPRQIQVVDNSEDAQVARELEDRLPAGVRVSFVANRGYANAVNLGVGLQGEASTTSILVLTHDVRLDAQAIPQMLAALDADPLVAAAGPLLSNGDRKGIVWSAGGYSTRTLRLPRHIYAGSSVDDVPKGVATVDWLDGSAVLYRSDLLRSQPLREEFFLYVEEYEYHTRLRSMGFQIACVRDANASQTSKGAPPYLKARNLQTFERLHGGVIGAALGVPFEICRELIRVVVGRQQLPFVAQMVSGWRDGRRINHARRIKQLDESTGTVR